MFDVKFNTYGAKVKSEILAWLGCRRVKQGDASFYPLKSIPPGWQWRIIFDEGDDKIFFLLKFGDKISDWTEEIIEKDDEDEYDYENNE